MNITEIENFPRGGKKIAPAKQQTKRKQDDNLFAIGSHIKPKKARKEKPKRVVLNNEEIWQQSLKFQGTLTYAKIQEGMVILSCIRHISNLAIQVEFPGLTFAIITINQISDTFNTQLSDQLKTSSDGIGTALKNVVRIGQLVPAKIMTVDKIEKGHEVQATLNPRSINGDRKHNSFKKNEIIWANVVSELDHGYELTVGVSNCRVFLPFKKVDEARKYEVGAPLYCIIHKVDSSDAATTLTVSARHEHLNQYNSLDFTLNDVFPGMRVELVVEEILPHGIKGFFFEKCLGYIDETQVFSKINMGKLKEGSTLAAYVLFVEPITKVSYLTLHGLEDLPEPQFNVGTVTSAKVASCVSRGLYLHLGKGGMGFVTNKRLLNTLPKEAQLNIVDAVRKKYPVGSHHDSRILDYNYMQQLYICTFEKQLLKERIFCVKDLELGQIVKVTVDKVGHNGLIVKVGHVQGFIPNLHLSNVEYSENIKTKFSVGMRLDARVLNITSEENVIFTLKQGLIESDKCLTKPEDALPNTQHVGFVVQKKISGALIAFYGNVTGWITNKVLNAATTGAYIDPRNYFFIGQVVSVWVLGFKGDKLQLSLNPGNVKKKKKVKVGDYLNGVVKVVRPTGVEVEVGRGKVEANIPIPHLSCNSDLCQIFQRIYQPGDEIEDLLCLKSSDLLPIMSRRESAAFKKYSLQICKLHELRKNAILRCSFEEATESGIYVSTPIKDYNEKILVETNNIKCKNNFEKHQSVVAKVLDVDLNARKIELAVISDNMDPKSVVNLFSQVLSEIDLITNLCCKKNMKFVEYKIGSRIKCKINRIEPNGDYYVILPNGIEGLIPSHLKPQTSKIDAVIETVVLDYDFMNNITILCGKNVLNQKINSTQDGFIKKSFYSSCAVKILWVTKFYVVGVSTDKQCNKQLIYLPLCFDENVPSFGQKVKVVINCRLMNRLIGLPKKFVLSFEKHLEKKEKQKKKKKQPKSEIEQVIAADDDDGDDGENSGSDSDQDSLIETETIDETIPKTEQSPSPQEAQEEESSDSDFKYPDDDLYNKISVSEAALSGTRSFYSLDETEQIRSESSSEDEEEEKEQSKKKKKMTPAERVEAAKREEERISKIEKQLADPTSTPQSAEEFDRLLLANPNSSELWLQYIAMHVAATELDKARAVGKKAIEVINMTLVKEKFNVWIALLNLENMYGTKESFEKVFEDAVRYNDSLDIYLSVIKMLAEAGKLAEMEEKIKKVRAKEKQNTKMWLEVGQTYYTLQKFREARNMKEAAIKSILDKKRQFDIILRFGIMEFQLGDLEQAIANFETILDTYPSKVNIWIIYVDQLVKRKNIEEARKVLERAINQKFPPKTMKILFQKFISFEEEHGSPDDVEKVKNLAKGYVTSLGVK